MLNCIYDKRRIQQTTKRAQKIKREQRYAQVRKDTKRILDEVVSKYAIKSYRGSVEEGSPIQGLGNSTKARILRMGASKRLRLPRDVSYLEEPGLRKKTHTYSKQDRPLGGIPHREHGVANPLREFKAWRTEKVTHHNFLHDRTHR